MINFGEIQKIEDEQGEDVTDLVDSIEFSLSLRDTFAEIGDYNKIPSLTKTGLSIIGKSEDREVGIKSITFLNGLVMKFN